MNSPKLYAKSIFRSENVLGDLFWCLLYRVEKNDHTIRTDEQIGNINKNFACYFFFLTIAEKLDLIVHIKRFVIGSFAESVFGRISHASIRVHGSAGNGCLDLVDAILITFTGGIVRLAGVRVLVAVVDIVGVAVTLVILLA